ncbi:MAG: hypothetical protein ACI4J7_10990 [Ruminiclostridium sp.]
MILNELLKVISRRNSIIAFLIMLAMTVIYTAFLPIEDSSQKAYNEFRADISGLSAEETGERLEERVLELTIYDALLWGEPDSPAFNDERAAEYIEKYKSIDKNSVEVYDLLKLYRSEYSRFLAVQNYREHIDGITNGNDALSSIIGSNFERKNAVLTKAAYEPMKTATPRYYPSEGCERTVRNFAVDISALTAAVLTALLLFGGERNGGTTLTLSMKNGNGKFALAKTGAVIVIAFLVLLAGSLTAALTNEIRFGLGDPLRQLCSLFGYYNTTLNITVLGFMIISLLMKTIAVSVFGMLAALLSLLTEKQTAVLFTFAATVVSAVIYYGIGSVSALAFLKFSSPAALSAPDELFGNYVNISVFGEPVNSAFVALLVCAVLLMTLTAVTAFIYRKCSVTREQRKAKTKDRWISDKIWVNELYRTFISCKGLVITALFIAGYALWLGSIQRPFDIDDMMYADYIRYHGGAITETTASYIEAEQARFDSVRSDMSALSEAFLQGKLTAADYNTQYAALSRQLMGERSFSRFTEQYERLKNIPDSELIYDTGYKKIYEANLIALLVPIVLTLFLTFPVYGTDRASRFDFYSRALKHGNKHLLYCRIRCGFIMSAVFTALFSITMTARYLFLYGAEDILSGVNNLIFAALPNIKLPIILMLGIMMLVDILIVSCIDIVVNVLLKHSSDS